MRNLNAVALVLAAVALAACQRTTAPTLPPQQPAPLAPAPVAGVDASQLPPPSDGNAFPQPPEQPETVSPEEVAALEANAPEVSREALVGRWSVGSAGETCDVFLALTRWTGGYRAASRGCTGEAAAITAWDVEGKQVVLSDASGNRVAQLYQSGGERYSGSTNSGQPITLSR